MGGGRGGGRGCGRGSGGGGGGAVGAGGDDGDGRPCSASAGVRLKAGAARLDDGGVVADPRVTASVPTMLPVVVAPTR